MSRGGTINKAGDGTKLVFRATRQCAGSPGHVEQRLCIANTSPEHRWWVLYIETDTYPSHTTSLHSDKNECIGCVYMWER